MVIVQIRHISFASLMVLDFQGKCELYLCPNEYIYPKTSCRSVQVQIQIK